MNENYKPSFSERLLLVRLRLFRRARVKNTPDFINLFNNGFLYWYTDTDTVALSDEYKRCRSAAICDKIFSVLGTLALSIAGGVILLLLELLL